MSSSFQTVGIDVTYAEALRNNLYKMGYSKRSEYHSGMELVSKIKYSWAQHSTRVASQYGYNYQATYPAAFFCVYMFTYPKYVTEKRDVYVSNNETNGNSNDGVYYESRLEERLGGNKEILG